MKLIPMLVLGSMLAACGGKDGKDPAAPSEEPVKDTEDKDNGNDEEDPAKVEQPKDVAAVYASVVAEIGTLQITDYSAASLALADETWTQTDWNMTARFNCLDEVACKGELTSASKFVHDSLDASKDGPVYDVKRKLDIFCLVGAMLPAADVENALPKVAAKHPLTIDADTVARLKTNCGLSDEDAADIGSMQASLTVTAPGGLYDRLLVFADGEGEDAEETPIYIKNSDGVIRVGMFEAQAGRAGNGISHTMIKFDLAAKVFQFEYVSPDEGGEIVMTRGYHDGTTKDVAFLSGKQHTTENVFLAVAGNEDDAQAGAYLALERFAGGDGGATLEGAFVCFNAQTGDFINATGCTNDDTDDRKREWKPTSAMMVAAKAKAKDDWGVVETTDIANFDTKTMFTLEPIYK